MSKAGYQVAFVVGSPRSGTTFLSDILDLHPYIGRLGEPYFVLDRYFRDAENDCRTESDATPVVKRYIRNEFEKHRRALGCTVVVDKSPRNSLKIPFLRSIFEDAKFIHVVRDGRDATLSIRREWIIRRETIKGRKIGRAIRTVEGLMRRKYLLEHKFKALLFEIGGLRNILNGEGWLHRLRWNGTIGWGPRFEGWQDAIVQVSLLEFNALQWTKCVDAVLAESRQMDERHFIEVHYETLLEQPEATLKQVFDFLELEVPANFSSQLPAFKDNNYNKWKTAFSDSEKTLIGPILNPLLMRMGYANDAAWYRQMS